jgi:hypothetical protein
MKMEYNALCPYCKHKNPGSITLDHQFGNRFIISCDSEHGGCDKDFVLTLKVKVEEKVFKIEGEENI